MSERPGLLQFRPRTLLMATGLIGALLLTVVLVPQMLARDARLQVLRNHVDAIARLAASQVDGDTHRRLAEGHADEMALRAARAQLLRLHQAMPEAFYMYTMAVLADGKAHFVLDTAQDAEFARRRGLKASQYMEPFELRRGYSDDWLPTLMAGHTYVNPGFQYDDYGYFLSGNAPIRDGNGAVAGFAAVDFDLGYYLAEEKRFSQLQWASVAVALLLSLLLGYGYARYRNAQQVEMRQHYESSMQDVLTGLPNRRGALAAIDMLWRHGDGHSHAALLVDIDNFKAINDTHGHAAGDEALRALARALSGCLRPGDIAARLGGDEFLVFARDCDRRGAELIAARLLDSVRAPSSSVPFSVSVGISVTGDVRHDGFDLLYREADKALYRAKNQGRDRYEVFATA
jgi:diguanylate cyclase (GGDEF)-like protein